MVGRSLDRLIERVRERRPRRYERRVKPSLREQARERAARAREFFREGDWKRLAFADERAKKRLIAMGSLLVVCVMVAVPWWVVRSVSAKPSLQELMDQAMVRARLEMAAQQSSDRSTMGSWGSGPGAGARIDSGMNRWGP